MNFFELLVTDVVETVSLIPPGREDVERDLAADGECQAVVGELLLQDLDKSWADAMLLLRQVSILWTARYEPTCLVIFLEVKTFLNSVVYWCEKGSQICVL